MKKINACVKNNELAAVPDTHFNFIYYKISKVVSILLMPVRTRWKMDDAVPENGGWLTKTNVCYFGFFCVLLCTVYGISRKCDIFSHNAD